MQPPTVRSISASAKTTAAHSVRGDTDKGTPKLTPAYCPVTAQTPIPAASTFECDFPNVGVMPLLCLVLLPPVYSCTPIKL